jgi:GMP reductase
MSLNVVDGVKLDFDDVLIMPKRSVMASRSAVELERKFQFYHSTQEWSGFPLLCSNMYCTGTFAMAKALAAFKAVTVLHKFYDLDQLEDFYFENQGYTELEKNLVNYAWLSIGIREEDIEKLNKLCSRLETRGKQLPNVVLDVANGYTDAFVKTCYRVRDILGEKPIFMAGNVCTPEQTGELIMHGGVDIVKVGIGPGQFCETRKVTGIGYPQLSAIADCADAAHGLKNGPRRLGLICADGGLRMSSDICKAYGAGGDFAMLGTYLAGTDECQGKWIERVRPKYQYVGDELQTIFCEGAVMGIDPGDRMPISIATHDVLKHGLEVGNKRQIKLQFYGMSSDHAQVQHYGEKIPYAASEGKVGYVDYKGPVAPIIQEVQGALRSYCSYINSPSLKDAAKCTTFVRIR